jgi:hypothetical protein
LEGLQRRSDKINKLLLDTKKSKEKDLLDVE